MVAKAEQSTRTKGALIEAAIALFGEHGYRATSIKAIAERAGITHGVIPFHFGSKDGLLLAVIETCFERFAQSVLGPLQDPQRTRDFGLGDLDATLRAQVAFSDAHPEVGRVFQVLMAESIASSPELRPHFRSFHQRLVGVGIAWMREGQARGALRSDADPETVVETLLAFLTGTRTHHLVHGLDRRRVHQQMMELLERALRPESTAVTKRTTPAIKRRKR